MTVAHTLSLINSVYSMFGCGNCLHFTENKVKGPAQIIGLQSEEAETTCLVPGHLKHDVVFYEFDKIWTFHSLTIWRRWHMNCVQA